MGKYKILIVEDDVDLREGLSFSFSGDGYDHRILWCTRCPAGRLVEFWGVCPDDRLHDACPWGASLNLDT